VVTAKLENMLLNQVKNARNLPNCQTQIFTAKNANIELFVI